jgi:predicted aspartyl protease
MTGHFSRRSLFGTGAAALALAPGLARAAAATTGTRLAPPPAVAVPGFADSIQGIADPQNRLTVETYVNGKGPYHFVVDTGADRSVLAEDLAEPLGLRPADDVIVQGIARALPARAVHLDNLKIGRVEVDSLVMPLLPRVWLGADGYLGLDVIDKQSVTFDFVKQRMIVEPSGEQRSSLYFDDVAQVRVGGTKGRLTAINCTVNDVRCFVFVDSGAEYSIGNSALFEEMRKNGATFINEKPVPLVGVTGGTAYGSVTALQQVRMGAVTFSKGALVVSDLPVFDIWGLGDKPAMFLGMNLLKTVSTFAIDYGRKELRFRLARADVQIASRLSGAA